MNSKHAKIFRKGISRLCLVAFISIFYGCSTDLTHFEGNTDPFSGMVKMYQGPANHLAPVRHSKCPMYPSCSQYSLEAFKKHGPFIGYIMTCDRLMRCGRDETKLAPRYFDHGYFKSFDPIYLNDFWWTDENDMENEGSEQ